MIIPEKLGFPAVLFLPGPGLAGCLWERSKIGRYTLLAVDMVCPNLWGSVRKERRDMEQIYPYLPYIWLGVTVLAAVVEGLTTQLISIWFVTGGIAAFLTALCGGPLWMQALLFSGVSVLALIVTRPFVRKITKSRRVPTNADRYLGQEGLVLEEINNQTAQGQVKVLGSIWTARTEDGSVLQKDTRIEVVRLEGVRLVVREKIAPAQTHMTDSQ